MGDDALYHIGFGPSDLADGTTIALLSGDPDRSELIATDHLADSRVLASRRCASSGAKPSGSCRPSVLMCVQNEVAST